MPLPVPPLSLSDFDLSISNIQTNDRKTLMSLKSIVTTAFAATTFSTPTLAEIEIHDPYARSSNGMAGAAFMIIHNHGDIDDHLLGVRSDAAQRVELHTHMEDDNGVMRMTHVEDGFDLPADGEILLQRGGHHVMFMGLVAPFEPDDLIIITLEFEEAGDVVVEIPVDQDRKADGAMDHGDHLNDHSAHDHSGHDHEDEHEGHDH